MPALDYPDVPLHEVMRATAARDPDRLAVVHGERAVSFGAFDLASNQLAHGLARLGLAPGERLGLFLPNGLEYELAFYAASKLGAIACPVNPAARDRELAYQLGDAGASLLLTHAGLWPTVEAGQPRLPALRHSIVVGSEVPEAARAVRYEELVAGRPLEPPAVRVDPGDLVALPYSSGTTGFPKGVMLTHRNLVANHVQFGSAGRLSAEDVLIVYVPLSHIYGIALMGIAMWSGARQILMERFDLSSVVRSIADHRATWLHVVPPVLLALAEAPGLEAGQFRTVKFLLNAAAPLAPDVARRVEARLGVRVIQAYGLTEASPDTHHSPLEPDRIRLESVGVPVAGTEQRIVDLERGERELPAGGIGEIVVRGPQVMKGYWNAPAETAAVLRHGWLHTGDIGWADEHGYTFVVDRKKEMIKYKGFSVAPAELEATVLEHPDVVDCAVVGVPDEEAGELPMAFVVARDPDALDLDGLEAFVVSRLASYKRIRRWKVVSAIPRTPSGKVLRRVLKEQVVPRETG